MKRWNILKRGNSFTAKIFAVDELECDHPDGISHTFSVIRAPDWINIVPVTKDGRFILVKQHRLGTDSVTIETPGGIVDHGEDPLAAAARELREETGFIAEEIIHLKSLQANPAIMDNTIHFYLAKGCEKAGDQDLDREEDIEVLTADARALSEMIDSNEINHSIVITALALFAAATGTDPSFLRN